MAATKTRRRPRAARVEARKPRPQGWRTSDDDEVERRRLRAAAEGIRVKALEPEQPFFGTYLAGSSGGGSYEVEIRSLQDRANTCGCPDQRVNGLGTCKHVEATLLHLERGGKRRFRAAAAEGPSRIEVYRDRRDGMVRVVWPRRLRGNSRARGLVGPVFSADGSLLADPLSVLPALERALAASPARVRRKVRISRHLTPWLDEQGRGVERREAREAFLADVAAGKRSLDVLDVPLYPYQHEGMLHLAFGGRALLADDMGLGKTVQAIAACELLRQLRGVERVLVISPASLKAEWEEQIGKFSNLPTLVLQGPRAERLRQYRRPAMFYLANYEQVRPDGQAIQEILAPDVIILDEAQRIKNWQTKTAQAVKRLRSPYAFVLTGTPLENRIDEIYSIVEYLDPELFGSLFRFNREFYLLDDRGRPQGYKNLDELHRRLRPLMLRRRKEEVDKQLPGRTVNNYFVGMHAEQRVRYAEYEERVARLLSKARRRPLTQEEYKMLQRWLACMRMLCDTPYILDAECRVSPKLHELEAVLDELVAEGGHKVIVFSEWERMLQLIRELAQRMGLGFAWHTGSVPQPKRRKEIRRFKDDPECMLFLSTDSGGVGLNLQVADVVINMDIPWNPAKLEQRIARAWRKHQPRSVRVVNLVSESSIEHRMLHMLEQKRTLADGVVDGIGDLKEMPMPSGRAAFVERLEAMMGEPGGPPVAGEPPAAVGDIQPVHRLRDAILSNFGERLELLQVDAADGDAPTVLAVLDRTDAQAVAAVKGAVNEHLSASAHLELLDRESYDVVRRLIDAGVLRVGAEGAQILHQASAAVASSSSEKARRLAEARTRFTQAERQHRMAHVLAAGGFESEAVAPLQEALEKCLRSLAYFVGEESEGVVPVGFIKSKLVGEGLLPSAAPLVIAELREPTKPRDVAQIRELLEAGRRIFEHAGKSLQSAPSGMAA